MRRKLVPVVALSMACLLAVTTACSTGNRKKRDRSADRPAGTGAKRDDVGAARATHRRPGCRRRGHRRLRHRAGLPRLPHPQAQAPFPLVPPVVVPSPGPRRPICRRGLRP
ncbi:hypothetical protein ACGF5C_17880 [Micromonospora sp. NPDC047620]|uniref:hypothetical protein n=1 Tax=Micromonospora sp. NPDC047620 TaxID=3364251 RepID=UPI00371E1F1D